LYNFWWIFSKKSFQEKFTKGKYEGKNQKISQEALYLMHRPYLLGPHVSKWMILVYIKIRIPTPFKEKKIRRELWARFWWAGSMSLKWFMWTGCTQTQGTQPYHLVPLSLAIRQNKPKGKKNVFPSSSFRQQQEKRRRSISVKLKPIEEWNPQILGDLTYASSISEKTKENRKRMLNPKNWGKTQRQCKKPRRERQWKSGHGWTEQHIGAKPAGQPKFGANKVLKEEERRRPSSSLVMTRWPKCRSPSPAREKASPVTFAPVSCG
jgi:hypothetical protein